MCLDQMEHADTVARRLKETWFPAVVRVFLNPPLEQVAVFSPCRRLPATPRSSFRCLLAEKAVSDY
jgi:hypothetical protein